MTPRTMVHVTNLTHPGSECNPSRGVDRDLNAAVQWYRKSAELGNPESAAALGSAYGAGVGPIKVGLYTSEIYPKP
jgi:TPR repeat protein